MANSSYCTFNMQILYWHCFILLYTHSFGYSSTVCIIRCVMMCVYIYITIWKIYEHTPFMHHFLRETMTILLNLRACWYSWCGWHLKVKWVMVIPTWFCWFWRKKTMFNSQRPIRQSGYQLFRNISETSQCIHTYLYIYIL